MAAGDTTVYSKYRLALFYADGGATLSNTPVDLSTETLKMMILDNTFVPDTTGSTTQEHTDDVSADEVTTGGTEYTGPITLASVTVAEAAGTVTLDAADIVVGIDASGFTDARYVVFYHD